MPLHNMQELITSRCRCGASFCHACGKRWKTCHCPLYNEQNNLLLVADDFLEPIDHVPYGPERPQDVDTHIAHTLRFGEAPPPAPAYLHTHPQHAARELEAYLDQHHQRFRNDQHAPMQPAFLRIPRQPQEYCTHFVLEERRRHNVGARCHRCNDRRNSRTWDCTSCRLELCTRCLLTQGVFPVSMELRARIRGPFSREYGEYFG